MINIKCVTVGLLEENCYIIFDSKNNEGIILDPGANIDKIRAELKKLDVSIKAVVLTHSHFDHSAHADDFRREYGIPLIIHEDEAELLKSPELNLSASYLHDDIAATADRLVNEGDIITFGKESLKVISTPGHTKGGMSLYSKGALFSGDTLFRLSIGRCDFGTGDESQIARSIKDKLFTLPDDTNIYPGHNRPSTIGFEKQHNNEALNVISRFCR